MKKVSKFQQDFFNKLISQHGFFVETVNGLDDIWIAMKKVGNGALYTVLVSTEENEKENLNSVSNYLKSKEVHFSIHNVILSKGQSLSETFEGNYHRIVLDVKKKNIISYDSLSEPIAKVILSILNQKRQNETYTSNGGGKKSKFNLDKLKKIFYKLGKTTSILIGINVVVFLISVILSTAMTGNFLGSLSEVNSNILYILGAKHNKAIFVGHQYYRLVSSMFLHGGLIHLAFNMYALYALGDTVEKIYGTKKYLIIYFVSGIISSITSLIFSQAMSVGASGAIFGLLGACLVFAYDQRQRIGRDFLVNILVVIAANVIIGMSMPNIDNFAHFGGLVGGVLITIVSTKYTISKKY